MLDLSACSFKTGGARRGSPREGSLGRWGDVCLYVCNPMPSLNGPHTSKSSLYFRSLQMFSCSLSVGRRRIFLKAFTPG